MGITSLEVRLLVFCFDFFVITLDDVEFFDRFEDLQL